MTDNTVRRTKIVATLGPATDDDALLQKMFIAGVDVARLNFSHARHAGFRQRLQQVRRVATAADKEVAVLADLQGPKIRIERFANGRELLQEGQRFELYLDAPERLGDERGVAVSYANLGADVQVGDQLLFDDGFITMRVLTRGAEQISCEVENGGILSDRKGLNKRGGGLSVPGLTAADLQDIRLAAELHADYLAVSFPRNAEDIHMARSLLREHGAQTGVIAKIERCEALDNLDEIIDASDAVLVARGDLGVEIGDAELPGIQKHIIHRALQRNCAVITATQMMQSMITSPQPTRAEVLDVANAILDGSDAVMLSAETAVGDHPLKVIQSLHQICLGAERHQSAHHQPQDLQAHVQRIDQAIAMAAMVMAENVDVQAILALTESGSTAKWLSRLRSSVPIYAASPAAASRRRMALYSNVQAIAHRDDYDTVQTLVRQALEILYQQGKLKAGDRVIVTMGDEVGLPGSTNTLKLMQISASGHADAQPLLFSPHPT